MTLLNITLETASPIHIGSGGADLRRDIDFAVFDQHLFMFDMDAVFNYILDQDNDRMIEQLQKTHNIASFFSHPKIFEQHPELYRYKLQGFPKLEQVRAAVKTVHGLPYIPGSSLKGALRTAWIRWNYAQRNLAVNVAQLNDRREWAFQQQEARLMSPKARQRSEYPNYDLFRAIQVADSQPAPDDSLRLYNAVVYPAGPKGIPIDIEGIKPRVVMQGRIKVDDFILQTKADRFGVADQHFTLEHLKRAWREQGMKRIGEEIVFWTGRDQGAKVLDTLIKIEQNAKTADENTFFIEVGWGTGWKSKTLGHVIKDNDLARVISKYRLSRSNEPHAERFPKTRRAARDGSGVLRVPFGWLKVTLNT